MLNDKELLPGLVLPAAYHGVLRKRLTEVDNADTVVNCLIAQARAEGMVEALELVGALDSTRIERLYQLVVDAATARLLELEQEQGE